MKSDKKTSVRLPSKRLEDIDQICRENGNCSRAKVIKDALDFVIKGRSEIKFEPLNQINNFDKPAKTLVIEHDNLGNIKNSYREPVEKAKVVIVDEQ